MSSYRSSASGSSLSQFARGPASGGSLRTPSGDRSTGMRLGTIGKSGPAAGPTATTSSARPSSGRSTSGSRIMRPTSGKLRPMSATTSSASRTANSAVATGLSEVTGWRSNASSGGSKPRIMEGYGGKASTAVVPPTPPQAPPQQPSPTKQRLSYLGEAADIPDPEEAERIRVRESVASFISTTVSKQAAKEDDDDFPKIREYGANRTVMKRVSASRPAKNPTVVPSHERQLAETKKSAEIVTPSSSAVVKNDNIPRTTTVSTSEKQDSVKQPPASEVKSSKPKTVVHTTRTSYGTQLTDAQLEALEGLVGRGERHGEYVRHFPEHGHYACRRCHTPLFSVMSKLKIGGGYAAFSKHYGHSLNSELHMKGAASAKNQALLLLQLADSPAEVRMSCVRCNGFIGQLSQERETDTGDYLSVNSNSIVYVNDEAPHGFAETEKHFTADDEDDPDHGAEGLDGVSMSAQERRDQQRRISLWGTSSSTTARRRTGDQAVYRGAVPHGKLLTAPRTDDDIMMNDDQSFGSDDDMSYSDDDAEDCFD